MDAPIGSRFLFVPAVVMVLTAGATPMHALGTAFTYQGQLQQTGTAVNGTCDFEFGLFDATSAGTQLGSTETLTPVDVTNGLFTVELNEAAQFGANAFNGGDRWLQIAVRCPVGTGSYTALTPRQQLTATPYALYAPTAASANALSCSGCVGASDLAPGAVTSSTIASGTIQPGNLAFTPGTVTSITAGTGLTGGTITTSGTVGVTFGTTAGTVAQGNTTWNVTGNSGTTAGTNFLGTTDNQPLELWVNGARALRLEPTASTPNVISGNSQNFAYPGVVGATIAGGGFIATGIPYRNQVTDSFGTVGGGAHNQAGNGNGNTFDANAATVAGGELNTASGIESTVGGGVSNAAAGADATVAGGLGNMGTGSTTTIGGGQQNTASGIQATVGGGRVNTAAGNNSTVSGGFFNIASANFATIAGGGLSNPADNSTGNHVTDDYGTVGGGGNNQAGNANGATYATVAGGEDNHAIGGHSTIGGGQVNTASGSESTVGGGFGNQAQNDEATIAGGSGNMAGGVRASIGGGETNVATGDSNTVAGGLSNVATGPFAATIGGGQNNVAVGNHATVAGGIDNFAGDESATVGGGRSNQAKTPEATVAGGQQNNAEGASATVAGGQQNIASGVSATVGGGATNAATNDYATVPGGYNNRASGKGRFAAGRSADATDDGSFVWGDGDQTANSIGVNSFAVLAGGGVGFYVGGGSCVLTNPAVGWNCTSDRNLKEHFTSVDSKEVLRRLSHVAITKWNGKGNPATTHMGPMAQDFHAAFQLGDDDVHINTVDAQGVALAAIQGLDQVVQEKEERITALEARLAAVERAVAASEGVPRSAPSGWRDGWLRWGGLFVVGAMLRGRWRTPGR